MDRADQEVIPYQVPTRWLPLLRPPPAFTTTL